MNLNVSLTKREAQITAYLAWGASKKQIADKLFISIRTVENHAKTIYSKIGVCSVAQLSAWYFCKNYNISLNLSPLKSTLALALLFVMLPGELKQVSQVCRNMKSVSIRYSPIRTGRRRDYYSDQFHYES